jgi:hypothetical protein
MEKHLLNVDVGMSYFLFLPRAGDGFGALVVADDGRTLFQTKGKSSPWW